MNAMNDGVCVVCEFAMQYIDKAIGNEKTRDKIEKVVHDVCNHLPKTVAADCNQFVDKYADAVISILSEDVSPKEVCTMIGLCKISMQQIQGISTPKKLYSTVLAWYHVYRKLDEECTIYLSISTESIEECALCRAVISQIDKLLGNPKIDDEIEDVVGKVCKFIPAEQYEKVMSCYLAILTKKVNLKLN